VRRQVSDRPPEMQGSVWNVVRHPCAGLLLPRYDVELQRHFECASARRLAATVLAVRWYACDHGGQLPARLDDLVPAYLPSVPADPFAETNAPIRYLNHPARPAVYSVGENGVDNGGCEPDRKLSWSERRKVADDVRYLRPRPRKPVPPPVVFPPFLSLQPPSE